MIFLSLISPCQYSHCRILNQLKVFRKLSRQPQEYYLQIIPHFAGFLCRSVNLGPSLLVKPFPLRETLFFILNKASWFNHLQNVLTAVSFENRLLFQLFVAPVLTCLRYVAEIKFKMNQYFTRKVTMYQFKHLVCFLCFTMQIILFTRCANRWILFLFPFLTESQPC